MLSPPTARHIRIRIAQPAYRVASPIDLVRFRQTERALNQRIAVVKTVQRLIDCFERPLQPSGLQMRD